MSNNFRLSSIAPDLVELGHKLSIQKRLLLAYSAAKWACIQTNVQASLPPHLAELLDSEKPVATAANLQLLRSCVDEFDEKYFVIVDQHDDLDDAGEAMRWFCRARAVAALQYAMNANEPSSFCETLYEAHAATNDLAGLTAVAAMR